MNKYMAKLAIYSEKYSAEEINSILKINFDCCWVKGEPRSKRSNIIKFEKHAWFLMSDLPDNITLNNHILRLFDRIQPFLDNFLSLNQYFEVYVNCTVEGNENPELNFDSQIIKLINSINGSLDIDTFIA